MSCYKELAETYRMRKASLLSVEKKCAKGRQHKSTGLLTNEFLVFRIDSEVSEADSGRASDDVDGEMRWRQHVNDDR